MENRYNQVDVNFILPAKVKNYYFLITQILLITFVAILYYLAARIGLLLAIESTNASPVWPPSGIALALILLFVSFCFG